MNKFIRDLFTGKDNETYDIGRVCLFIGCMVFFYLCGLETYRGHDFKPIEFGTGFGLIIGSGALVIALKS